MQETDRDIDRRLAEYLLQFAVPVTPIMPLSREDSRRERCHVCRERGAKWSFIFAMEESQWIGVVCSSCVLRERERLEAEG